MSLVRNSLISLSLVVADTASLAFGVVQVSAYGPHVAVCPVVGFFILIALVHEVAARQRATIKGRRIYSPRDLRLIRKAHRVATAAPIPLTV